MRISDWSSDVCSSDLVDRRAGRPEDGDRRRVVREPVVEEPAVGRIELPVSAITLDLDDTIWPIAPVIQRAENILGAWLREAIYVANVREAELRYGLPVGLLQALIWTDRRSTRLNSSH